MTTRLLSRVSRVLFALWFVAMIGDTGVLHSCAMHGGAGHVHGGMSAHAMAGHGSHGTHHDRAPVCSCLGDCCAVTAVVPLPAAPTINVATVAVVPVEPLDHADRVVPTAADVRLPFANGPPTA